jgi:hypothetical protein
MWQVPAPLSHFWERQERTPKEKSYDSLTVVTSTVTLIDVLNHSNSFQPRETIESGAIFHHLYTLTLVWEVAL